MSEAETIKEAIINEMHGEHCSYKSTREFLATLPTKGEHVVVGPGENAGVVDLGEGLYLAFKAESHNHPSAKEPYHGAATCMGGIIRDVFTMGARPIAVLDLLRLGTNVGSKYLLEQIVRGISDYGNCFGVANIGGDVFFDQTYNQNPLVNGACFGLVEKENLILGKTVTPGNDLIYVGARTGRDGVGGASFASRPLEDTNDLSAIQKGDPYLEKLLLEACLELSETDFIEGMQDMGAAGLLCSTTEPANRGQKETGLPIGSKVWLGKIPTKAENMSPVELLTSESQERMMIIGKRKYREKIMAIFKKWDLEAHVVGAVTSDGNYTLDYTDSEKREVFSMSIKEICDPITEQWPLKEWRTQGGEHTKASTSTTDGIWHQYDWAIGTRTLKGPDKPGHYAILDIDEIGKELVISWSTDEGRSDVHPTIGIQYAFDKAYTRLIEQKAKPLGLTNCLNFGHPKDSMGAFLQTIVGLSERCLRYDVPVVSGNVSLYNGVGAHSIKPTPVIIMAGLRGKR